MAKKTPRPGRTLLIFGLAILVLYGLAALGQTWKPRLGLDLEGGTRITLSAIEKGVTPTKLKQAAAIVEARANGSGVSESEVSTSGRPQHHRRDPRQERLQPRRLGQAHGPAALPHRGRHAAAGQARRPRRARPRARRARRPRPRRRPPRPPTRRRPTRRARTLARPRSRHPRRRPARHPSPRRRRPPRRRRRTTAKGAPVTNPVAWAQNPGDEWLQKFAAFTCPEKGKTAAPVADNPDQPLITCDDKGQKFLLSNAVIEGTDLKSASYGIPQNGTTYAVNLAFKSKAPEVFGKVSTQLHDNGGTFAIVLDGQVVSYAGVNEPILDGNAQITGDFSESEARSLSNSLKYGALPLRFSTSVETIGPSLAGDQLSAGIYAGIIGLAIVMIYCMIYYRGLGLVVVASLIIAGIVTYGVVLVLAKSAGFTLTLPGIAGLIVAVGITADSFIVYFERIRDEMREGRSMRVAVETGWARARNTCLAADAVSLLAAVVLYIFAIGVVRGFAFALGVSTIIDVAVFFWFTKPTMTILARYTFFNSGSRFSGLSRASLGIDEGPHVHVAGGRA